MAIKLDVWLDDEAYFMLLELVNSAEDARTSEVLKAIIYKEYSCCKGSNFSSNNLEARITHIEEFDIRMLNSRFSTLLDKVLDLDKRVRELYYIKPIV